MYASCPGNPSSFKSLCMIGNARLKAGHDVGAIYFLTHTTRTIVFFAAVKSLLPTAG